MAFPRLPAPMLLASFILLLYWTTSSAESHDPTSADLSPPYRVKRDLKGDVEASSQVVKDTLTVVKEVIEKIDPNKLSAVMKGLANFASLAPGIGSLVSSVIIVVLNFTPQEDAQKELFAEVNRKLDSLSIQISNLATDVEWFNYASVYSQDEVRILNAWKKFNEFLKNSELVDSEETKLRLAEVFTSYYENTATEASVANLYLYLTVSSTSLSGNLNELLKKKFKCGIPEIGKYNLYFSSLLWKGMVLNQVYWNLIGLKPSGKEAEHTEMFKMVYKAQKSAVNFCLDNYKQYMIKDVEEISKANSPDNKTDIAVQVKNKLDEKYNWYNWVVLVYDSAQETYHILYDLTKIPVGKITVAVGNIRNPEEKGRALKIMFDVDDCYRKNTGTGIGVPVYCDTYPQEILQCLHDLVGVPVKMINNVYNYDVGLVPETLIHLDCLTGGTYSRISIYFSGRITPCSDNTCDRGECKMLLEGTNEHLCECPEGWGGDRCEKKMDLRDVPVTDIGQAVPDISTISARLKLMEASQKRMEAKLEEILGTLRNSPAE